MQPTKGMKLRIGTRGSPLALAQANAVCGLLSKVHGLARDALEVCVIKTTGDQIQDRPLADAGGKGLFTKEIEAALLSCEIDLAVHSAKDMTTLLPDGLAISACLEREDPRDVLISLKAKSIEELPQGASLGTASLRRQAQVKRLRPDLRVSPLRGNVETRLKRLRDGVADATILAMAGLRRLGLTDAIAAVLSTDQFLPAVGQGTVAIESRIDDAATSKLLSEIDHRETALSLIAERAFLAVLEGSCRTPIAGYATLSGGTLEFRGMVLRPDGSEAHEIRRSGSIEDAMKIGSEAGQQLKSRVPPDFLTLSQ